MWLPSSVILKCTSGFSAALSPGWILPGQLYGLLKKPFLSLCREIKESEKTKCDIHAIKFTDRNALIEATKVRIYGAMIHQINSNYLPAQIICHSFETFKCKKNVILLCFETLSPNYYTLYVCSYVCVYVWMRVYMCV